MDNNIVQSDQPTATEMLEVQSVATMFCELLEWKHLKMHLELLIIMRQDGEEDEFQCRAQHTLVHRKDTLSIIILYWKWNDFSKNSLKIIIILFGLIKSKSIKNFTSDNDRTGGVTQSSQHFDKTVSKTIGGGTPSHLVRNCNWRRFN